MTTTLEAPVRDVRAATQYRVCTRCIMDTSDPEISFDARGYCNHCRAYDEIAATALLEPEAAKKELERIVERIQTSGRGKPYDCIIGVSGGVDSTYVGYITKKLGLRPLAVHLDNGWDSELAVKNIEHVVNKLGIDLHTHVIDWEEFKDLQLSFLRASVPDAEIPTDHAIIAIMYQLTLKHGIQLISGNNVVTEGILPYRWTYGIQDWRYISAIHRQFGSGTLKTFPYFTRDKMLYYQFVKGISSVQILDYMPYVKSDVMHVLQDELGWKYYGGKHYESIYTRFFQGYILPTKFGIDKRRAHFSTLICSDQMIREDALEEMKQDSYSGDMLNDDREYVIKKLGLNEKEFQQIMSLPVKCFRDYPNYRERTPSDGLRDAFLAVAKVPLRIKQAFT